jgi:thioredoxin 1
MKNITNEQEFNEFISSEEKVIVDFWATWCGPCKAMAPLLEKAEEAIPARIAKVDVDEARELADKFNIRSIPTILVFQNSMMVDKKVGAPKNVQEIVQMLN